MFINPIDRDNKIRYPNLNVDQSFYYYSSSPKEKIQKLYSLFPNKFKDYVIFDKPFLEDESGRVNFVTQKHRKLFFSRLYKYNKDICIKYLKEYNEHDNYFSINNVENSKQERDFIIRLSRETLIETIPRNLIQFIYLNEKFSDWPKSEQRRFLMFIKTVGGKDALDEFDKSIRDDVENKEKGFREWLGEQKVIPKWLDKYGNPDMVAKINFIEKFFSKLDDIVIPKIIAMPHDPSHPEKDPRYTLLCEYAYFIVARNAINPISWYVGLASTTKLFEEWDKLVYLCKSGSPEEFALFLGQIIGTLLSIPLGIKVGSLAKAKMPIAIATVKALIKKTTKGKIDPTKIEKIFLPKKSRSERLKEFKQKRFTRTLNRKTPLKTRRKLAGEANKAIGAPGSKEQKMSYESLVRNEHWQGQVMKELREMPKESQRSHLEELYHLSDKPADKFHLAYFAREYGHYDLALKYTRDCYEHMMKIEKKGVELYPGNKELSAKAKASAWADIYHSLYDISKNTKKHTADFNVVKNQIDRMSMKDATFRGEVKDFLEKHFGMKKSEIQLY